MSSKSTNSTFKPAQKVFNTTELLEHILSFMPMTHVLGKSRVSRKWKAIIDNSPALRGSSFFVPTTAKLKCFVPTIPSQSLKTGLRTWIMDSSGKLHVTHEIEVDHLSHLDSVHPLIAGLEIVSGKYSSSYVRHRFGQSLQKTQANSSWRRMYLTTPPVTDIVIHVPITVGPAGYTGSLDDHITVNIHSEHGVTLGLLHETVEGTLRTFRMKDGRPRAQQRKEGPLKEDDYVKGWGKKERIMFLVQPKEDAADLELQ